MSADRPTPKPRKPTARPGDLIVPLTLICPNCQQPHVHYIPILIEPQISYERDEFGQLIRDAEGRPIPRTRTSYQYDQVPRVHPQYNPEMEDNYRILAERALEEKRLQEKPEAAPQDSEFKKIEEYDKGVIQRINDLQTPKKEKRKK